MILHYKTSGIVYDQIATDIKNEIKQVVKNDVRKVNERDI